MSEEIKSRYEGCMVDEETGEVKAQDGDTVTLGGMIAGITRKTTKRIIKATIDEIIKTFRYLFLFLLLIFHLFGFLFSFEYRHQIGKVLFLYYKPNKQETAYSQDYCA